MSLSRLFLDFGEELGLVFLEECPVVYGVFGVELLLLLGGESFFNGGDWKRVE